MRNRLHFEWCVSIALFACLCGDAFSQTAPKLLPFQGRLTDQNGVAVADGARLVQFKIYDVPTGGAPVWAGELHRTTVNGGLVNVMLGSKTPFAGVDFDKTLYLEITVDVSGPGGQPDGSITAADPPMLPRQIILPAVFAKESADSRKLAGYDWTHIFGTNSPLGAMPGNKIQSKTITAGQIAPGAVGTAEIAANGVRTTNIADGQITAEKLSSDLTRDSVIPPGAIQAFGGNSIPAGWLLCDGRAVAASDYPKLYSALGTAWGAGYTNISGVQVKVAATDFNVPDLRGLFLRGVSGTRGDGLQDPDASARVSPPGGNSGNALGSQQPDGFMKHRHAVYPHAGAVEDPKDTTGANGGDTITYVHGSVTSEVGGSETRPKNAYVNYIIKY